MNVINYYLEICKDDMLVRNASSKDLHEIAKVHIACFPDYFSTRVGKKNNGYLLKRLYEEYFKDFPGLFVVLEDDNGKIVGFCSGSLLEITGHQGRFIRNNRVKVLSRVAWLLLKGDSLAWTRLRQRYKKPVYKIIDHSFKGLPKTEIGDLVSICVLPEYRGKQFSGELMKRFVQNMWDLGRKVCLVSMHSDNKRAMSFYSKFGFILYRYIGDSVITYWKDLRMADE